MLYGNSFTNPIIYNACNEEFRKCFRGYFSLWIKPCARLVLGDRRMPEFFQDIETTIPRNQRSVSFKRLSRKDTFDKGPYNTRTNSTKKHREKNHNNVNEMDNGQCTTVSNSNNQCHVILLHKNNINQYHTTVRNISSKNDAVQYVSGL